jgi:protocatechuate 3,4-dioxygenase beta subunit
MSSCGWCRWTAARPGRRERVSRQRQRLPSGRGAWLLALAVMVVVALGWLVATWSDSTPAEQPARRTVEAEAESPPPLLPEIEPLAEPPVESFHNVEENEGAPTPAEPAEDFGLPENHQSEEFRVVVVDGQAVPVPDARVRVWMTENACEADEIALQEQLTDSRGRATVTMPGDRDPVLVAERDDLGSSGMWQRHAVSWGRTLDGETAIPLLPRSRVRVLVLEADQRPAIGATVQFWSSGGGPGVKPRVPRAAVTDSQGRVECEFDANARLKLRAQDGERRTLEERVKAGAGTEHEVVLRFPGDWSIAGTVVDAGQRPVAGANVRLWLEFPGFDIEGGVYPKENCYGDDAKSADDGSFRFAVPKLAGYTLLASAEGRPAADVLSVQVDELHTNPAVTLTLPDPSAIAGRLRTEEDGPLEGVEIRAAPGGIYFPLAALYAPSRQERFGSATAVTDAEGRFRLEGLHPRGIYQLSCVPDSERPNRRATRDEVPAGTLDLDWVVSEADLVRAAVSGVVLSAEDGRPIESFTVQLVERAGRGFMYRDGKPFSDPEGRFRLDGLVLGTSYSLKITAEGWADTDVPGWTASADLHEVIVHLERPGTLEVEVRDEFGTLALLAQVGVELQAEVPPLSWRHSLRTDDTGLVRFEALDPGLYHVTATRGELRAEVDVTVGGGVVTRARLDLRQP